MKFIADLHFHSKYSRAVSPQMTLENIAEWGQKKGIDILTTTDFTHPKWIKEIKENLKQARPGVYKLRGDGVSPFFVLTTELSLIYSNHRVHLVVLAPNIETVEKLNQVLEKKGFNLAADGRPILGIDPIGLIKILKEVDKRIFVLPAHIWTPWFSIFGSRSGYDSFKECFGQFSQEVTAVESGLSSDPLMNWQVPQLDNKIIVSLNTKI
jgi:DNA helicase-2/ATP-dependent DNA helicase PcrA